MEKKGTDRKNREEEKKKKPVKMPQQEAFMQLGPSSS